MRTYSSVKGSTTDVTTCGICGREELRRTVVLHQFDYDTKDFIGNRVGEMRLLL